MTFYKMTVAYDGTRFNGFQRQITNGEMESRTYPDQCLPGSHDNVNDSSNGTIHGEAESGCLPIAVASVRNGNKNQSSLNGRRALVSVPKRPHWVGQSGKKKRVACTVQDCIEDAIASWTHSNAADICLRFAGRTDAGVHARGQVIRVHLVPPLRRDGTINNTRRRRRLNVDRIAEHKEPPCTNQDYPNSDDDVVEGWEPFEIQNAINSRLPVDISVVNVEAVPTNERGEPLFDPRRHVSMKQYSYALKFRRKAWLASSAVATSTEGGADGEDDLLPICHAGPNSFRHAFDSPCCWVVPWPLDDSLMESLCRYLQGRHNFAAFVHKDSRQQHRPSSGGGEGDGGIGRDDEDDDEARHEITLDSMRYEILSESREDAAVVTARLVFESKGFRRSMVRNLVGFCVDICRGLPMVTGDSFIWHEVWSEPAASKIHAAPACGLCLEWVRY
jgi:tRNA pseudouridine(38-40) synthase